MVDFIASAGGQTAAGGAVGSIHSVIVPDVPETPLVTSPPPVSPPMQTFGDFGSALATTSFALQHAATADSFVQSLAKLAGSLQAPVISPVFPTNANAPAIAAPIAPQLIPVVYSPPSVPAAFNQQLDATASFASFDQQPPLLLFPSAPTPTALTLPAAPSVDLNFTYPTVAVTLPSAPQLLSVGSVSFDGVTFPKLTATAPVLDLVAPTPQRFIADAPYTDMLLMELQAMLLARLDTGITGTNTGLPVAVEANLWNREREREYRQLGDGIAALDRMEAMGYALPSGAFIDARIKLETEMGYTIAGASRDQAIAQAKLEQDNIKQAIDAATQLEAKLIDYSNSREQRTFDAVKYATDAAVTIYNAQVTTFAQRVALYGKTIDIYQAQIEGAKAQVAIYTAEIDAEKLKVEVNQALVSEYKVMVDAALASLQVFEGEISVLKTRAEIEQLKVSVFGEEVRSYAAQANVYATQVEAYKAGVQAEGAKSDVYATQVRAYGSLIDATAKQVDLRIETYKALIAGKEAELDAYKAAVEGAAENTKAIAAANTATAAIYSATVQGTSAYNETLTKEWQAILQEQLQVTQIGVQAAQANGQLYISSRQLASDAAKVGAQVEAQLAASALGAVTWQTHRSRQDSVGFSTSRGYTESKGMSQSSGTSTATNTSFQTSMSSNVSAQTSSNKSEQEQN